MEKWSERSKYNRKSIYCILRKWGRDKKKVNEWNCLNIRMFQIAKVRIGFFSVAPATNSFVEIGNKKRWWRASVLQFNALKILCSVGTKDRKKDHDWHESKKIMWYWTESVIHFHWNFNEIEKFQLIKVFFARSISICRYKNFTKIDSVVDIWDNRRLFLFLLFRASEAHPNEPHITKQKMRPNGNQQQKKNSELDRSTVQLMIAECDLRTRLQYTFQF